MAGQGVAKEAGKSVILDAAEKIFALKGYDGTSMRMIAGEADVAQALIHYHFKTKEQLFEDVIARRSGMINSAREMSLKALQAENAVTLEALLHAFFKPNLELGHDRDGGGHYYARLLATTASANDERSVSLTRRFYDPIACLYIAAIQEVLPNLDDQDVVWGYLFAVGIALTSMSKTGRAEGLSGGQCNEDDMENILSRNVKFTAAGMRALSREEKPA